MFRKATIPEPQPLKEVVHVGGSSYTVHILTVMPLTIDTSFPRPSASDPPSNDTVTVKNAPESDTVASLDMDSTLPNSRFAITREF